MSLILHLHLFFRIGGNQFNNNGPNYPPWNFPSDTLPNEQNFTTPPSTNLSAIERYPSHKVRGHKKKGQGAAGIVLIVGGGTLIASCAALFLLIRSQRSRREILKSLGSCEGSTRSSPISIVRGPYIAINIWKEYYFQPSFFFLSNNLHELLISILNLHIYIIIHFCFHFLLSFLLWFMSEQIIRPWLQRIAQTCHHSVLLRWLPPLICPLYVLKWWKCLKEKASLWTKWVQKCTPCQSFNQQQTASVKEIFLEKDPLVVFTEQSFQMEWYYLELYNANSRIFEACANFWIFVSIC